MPEMSMHKKELVPVAAVAVVIVTVPESLSAATEPMVGAPVPGPLRSALQKLLATATAAAPLKVKPAGNVKTICPVDGMAVEAKNSM